MNPLHIGLGMEKVPDVGPSQYKNTTIPLLANTFYHGEFNDPN